MRNKVDHSASLTLELKIKEMPLSMFSGEAKMLLYCYFYRKGISGGGFVVVRMVSSISS